MLSRLADIVPPPAPQSAGVDAGLGAADLLRLEQEWAFGDFAKAFPTRSGVDRIARIAWFGAILADIGCSPSWAERDQVLREGALFNLAVALFDTVVDDQPSQLPATALALRPGLLMSALRDGVRLAPGCHRTTDTLVDLFNDVLLSAGRRLCQSRETINRLGGLLDRMYRSELGIDRDRLTAKILPIVFIGLLGDRCNSVTTQRLYQKLSKFICMWDDWNDLADDIMAGRANWFASDGGGWSVGNIARPCWRVLGGRVSQAQIERTLYAAIQDAVAASHDAPADAMHATLLLLRVLLGQEKMPRIARR